MYGLPPGSLFFHNFLFEIIYIAAFIGLSGYWVSLLWLEHPPGAPRAGYRAIVRIGAFLSVSVALFVAWQLFESLYLRGLTVLAALFTTAASPLLDWPAAGFVLEGRELQIIHRDIKLHFPDVSMTHLSNILYAAIALCFSIPWRTKAKLVAKGLAVLTAYHFFYMVSMFMFTIEYNSSLYVFFSQYGAYLAPAALLAYQYLWVRRQRRQAAPGEAAGGFRFFGVEWTGGDGGEGWTSAAVDLRRQYVCSLAVALAILAYVYSTPTFGQGFLWVILGSLTLLVLLLPPSGLFRLWRRVSPRMSL